MLFLFSVFSSIYLFKPNIVIVDDYNFTRPFSYVKHLNFLDTREFNLPLPIYINIVRHPVDRVQSWYYYHRAPAYIINPKPQDINVQASVKSTNETDIKTPIQQQKWNWKKGKAPNLRFLKTSYTECVENGFYECQYNKGKNIII